MSCDVGSECANASSDISDWECPKCSIYCDCPDDASVGSVVVCAVGSVLAKANVASTCGANDDEVAFTSCCVSDEGRCSWPTE